MAPSHLITPAPSMARRIVPLTVMGLLLSNCLASGRLATNSGTPSTGTFVLEWKNPTPDLEFSFGHGESQVVWRSTERTHAGSGPIQFQTSLPPGRGTLSYAFRDPGRPETEVVFSHAYD